MPPHGHIGAIAPEQRQQVIAASLVAGHYEQAIDRESAEEVLLARAQAAIDAADKAAAAAGKAAEAEAATRPAPRPESAPAPKKPSGGGYQRQGMAEALGKSVIRAAGSEAGRRLARGLLGSLLRK